VGFLFETMRHGFLLLATVCSAFAAESSFLDTPGPVPVSDLLPPALIENGQCTIATDAHAEGLHATYRISSESGSEEITGTQLLANRLRELQAIDSLCEMNKSAEFGKSLLKSGGEKIQSVGAAVKDPVGTVKKPAAGGIQIFRTRRHRAFGREHERYLPARSRRIEKPHRPPSPRRVSGKHRCLSLQPLVKSRHRTHPRRHRHNTDPVLAQASQATSPEDAVYFVKMSRLLEKYHKDRAPITEFRTMAGIPCAIDRDGALLVAIGADLILWTPNLETRADEFLEMKKIHHTAHE
jgi:hypothetical protein